MQDETEETTITIVPLKHENSDFIIKRKKGGIYVQPKQVRSASH